MRKLVIKNYKVIDTESESFINAVGKKEQMAMLCPVMDNNRECTTKCAFCSIVNYAFRQEQLAVKCLYVDKILGDLLTEEEVKNG